MKILDTHAKNLMKNMLTECPIWKYLQMSLNNKHRNAGRYLIKCVTLLCLSKLCVHHVCGIFGQMDTTYVTFFLFHVDAHPPNKT